MGACQKAAELPNSGLRFRKQFVWVKVLLVLTFRNHFKALWIVQCDCQSVAYSAQCWGLLGSILWDPWYWLIWHYSLASSVEKVDASLLCLCNYFGMRCMMLGGFHSVGHCYRCSMQINLDANFQVIGLWIYIYMGWLSSRDNIWPHMNIGDSDANHSTFCIHR